MAMAILTVPFSVFFHFAYDVPTYCFQNVYRNIPLAHIVDMETGSANSNTGLVSSGVNSTGSTYQGGFLGIWAWLGTLNPSELLSGFVFGLTMLNPGTVRPEASNGEGTERVPLRFFIIFVSLAFRLFNWWVWRWLRCRLGCSLSSGLGGV